MKKHTNTKHTLLAPLVVLGLAAALSAAPAQGEGDGYGRSVAPAPLEGTWIVTIRPVFCTSTPAANAGDDIPGVAPIIVFMSFAHGGTLFEANSATNFEPGQRSSGLGYWERTGRTSYRFVYQAFIQFDSTLTTRYRRGYQRLDHTLELHAADEFTSTGTTQFFAGTTTTPIPPSGCGRSTGARMY
jgi:hypothetical protein